MSTSIDCYVDTEPMAREINSVSHHVAGTTGAVVAMKGAVVKAESDAADHVCRNVNLGFYTMIRSQISQKIAKLQSEVDSLVMQLHQQTRMLLNIKTRMENDYNMISARYSKLFGTLNQSLKQRIYEIDKPTFNFVEQDLQQISNRPSQLISTVPLSQLESITMSQRIIASNLKNHAFNVIGSMSSFLTGMGEQKKITDSILLRQSVTVDTEQYLLPAIVAETCMDKSGATNVVIAVNNEGYNKAAHNMTRSRIMDNYKQFAWHDQNEIQFELQNEFQRLVSNAAVSNRVKETMSQLFYASKFQTL